MLPCPMHSAPTLIYPEASVADSQLLSGGPSHSCGAVWNRYIAFNPAYSQSSLYSTMDHAITTPLFLITSLQPLCFHVIAHSFPQRRSAIRFAFNNLHTLSVATGGGTPRHSYSRLLRLCVFASLWQIPCSQQLAASCTSLCAIFRAPFLCFQSFAASFFQNTRGGGYLPFGRTFGRSGLQAFPLSDNPSGHPIRNVDSARTSNYHCCKLKVPGPWMKPQN